MRRAPDGHLGDEDGVVVIVRDGRLDLVGVVVDEAADEEGVESIV